MITPPYLRTGDVVALMAPARFMDLALLDPFKQWVEEQGWGLQLSPNLGKQEGQLGGTIEERINDWQWAIEKEDIKAVFCARGGYGSMQLLTMPTVDFPRKNPKWLVGFSDITALHIHLNQLGLASIHGPMAMQFHDENLCSSQSKESLASVLKGEPTIWYSDSNFDTNGSQNTSITTNNYWGKPFLGKLWGGNMSLVYAMLAAGYQAPQEPFVLLLEDLDEYLYHIDRMAMAFHLHGIWRNCEAVLVGSMNDMHDNDTPFGKNAKQIITEFCDFYQKPLLYGLPIGHEAENRSIKLGIDITFDGSYLKQD